MHLAKQADVFAFALKCENASASEERSAVLASWKLDDDVADVDDEFDDMLISVADELVVGVTPWFDVVEPLGVK